MTTCPTGGSTDRASRHRSPRLWLVAIAIALGVSLLWSGWSAVPAARAAGDDKTDKKSAPELDVKQLKLLIKQTYMAADDAGLREILMRYGRVNRREPVRAILDIAQLYGNHEETEDWYWKLLRGAGAFNRPLALSEIGSFCVQYRAKPISRDLLSCVQSNRSKYVNRVIRRVLKDCPLDMQLMAVDMAAQIPVRRTVDVLMPFYEREDGNKKQTMLRKRIVLALEALTNQELGDNFVNWNGWWQANRHKGLKVIREESEVRPGTTGLARPIDPIRERQFIGLEKMPEGKVLVVEGPIARNGVNTNNDDISEVLRRLNIPHDKVLKEELEKDSYSIDQYAAILINCTQIHKFCQSPGHRAGNAVGNRLRRCLGPNPHDTVEFRMHRAAQDKLKAWVARGGYLFTEDWVLKEALAPMFPRFVAVGEKLEESTVDIRAARGQTTNPMLRGVFVPPVKLIDVDWEGVGEDDEDDADAKKAYDPSSEDDEGDSDDDDRGRTSVGSDPEEGAPEELEDPDFESVKHEWKVDNESNAIDVRTAKVQVLITSKKLKNACGSSAVAITFPHRKGRVLHVLSHFGKQNSSHNEATIENLLVNFLIEVKVRMKLD